MMTYQEFAELPISEKSILCTIEATTQFKIFTLDSGTTYYRNVPYFVTRVRVNGTDLIKMDNPTLSPGEFYYEITTKKLYVRLTDGSNPKTKTVIATYKFFFSNGNEILPHDLNEGEDVEWEGRIDAIGNIGQQLDNENTGIVLESSSSITMKNDDGYFDPIFDTIVWENQTIEFYSWSPKIPVTMAVKLFSGVIESKAFNSSTISFSVKDFVYRLRNLVALENFSAADGSITPAMIGKPKRRIYGKIRQVQTVGIDQVLSGITLTGTISVAINSTAVTGVGTQFLKYLSPGDELFVPMSDGTTTKLSVDTILTDTTLTLGSESTVAITAASATYRPEFPTRYKNRRWHIAGHPLCAPVSTIVLPITSRKFYVDNTEDFYVDDLVELNLNNMRIARISGNYIITDQAIDPLPDIGNTIDKQPVSRVYFGPNELLKDRDWTLTNFPDAIIEIDEKAEFNIAPVKNCGLTFTFTHNSRTVTTTATVDLRTIMSPRDWIKKNNISEPDYYEVLDVREQTVTIRTPYINPTAVASTTGTLKVKNIQVIADDAIITVDCVGKRVNSGPDFGKWIRTPAEVVKDLILYDAGFPEINVESFAQAKADCNYLVSMVIPEDIGSTSPSVRDIISKINDSVFGSLYGDMTSKISFSVFNSRKPESMKIIQDHDILSWSCTTEQKIVNRVKVNYQPFVDFFTGEQSFQVVEFESDFVDKYMGIQNVEERTIYLYDSDKATIIAQRLALYRSLSNCKVSMKAKLNFALTSVNDKIYIELDRLFQRYGGYDTKKICIVTGVKKNGTDVELDMIDMGNVFNRVPSIAPLTVPSYATAARDDSVRFGFILDNDTLTPDNTIETDLGNNRIG